MREFIINEKELLYYLFSNDYIGKGSFGIVCRYNKDDLIKIYYRDIFSTYITKDASKLNEEIDLLKEITNYRLINKEVYELNVLKLKKLYELNLIKGITLYHDWHIGTIIPYYKDYNKLSSIDDRLTKNELLLILNKVKENLETLIDNNLYPSDIREDNILVRESDLEVKLIDLDDIYTRYEEKNYVKEHPYIRDECYEKFKVLKRRLYL